MPVSAARPRSDPQGSLLALRFKNLAEFEKLAPVAALSPKLRIYQALRLTFPFPVFLSLSPAPFLFQLSCPLALLCPPDWQREPSESQDVCFSRQMQNFPHLGLFIFSYDS